MIARYLLGLRGDALTADLGLTASAAAIAVCIVVGWDMLNSDGSVATTAIDGILIAIARYLLGIEPGASLLSGQPAAMDGAVATNIKALLP